MDGLAPYLAWARVERGLSDATLTAYGRELVALGQTGEIAVLGSDELRTWLHSRECAPATIARRLAALRSYFGFLVRTGIRTDDPTAMLSSPKVSRGLPRPIDDVDEALGRLDATSQAIAILLLETGMRISEAMSIQIGTPAPDLLRVTGKGDKTRLIPLTPEARAALDELGGSVPLAKRTIQRRFAAAGFTPHALRHTLACELIASGADLGEVQEILGHASPQTTRTYAAYSTERTRAALERRR